MLRIVTPWNAEVFRIMPSAWRKFPIDEIGEVPTEGEIVEIHSRTDQYSLLVSGVVLPDGYILQIGVSNSRRFDLLAQYRTTFLFIALPLAALSLAGGYFVASRALSPIRSLSRLTGRIIETGSLDERIPTAGTRDELDELARRFNQMLERIAALVSGIRESLDNVAHDLRTPLTRLRSTLESAVQPSQSAVEYREALRSAMEESERMLAMLSALMDISEAETGTMRLDRTQADLADIVADMAELYGYSGEEKGVTVRSESDHTVQASVDVNRIRQAVANLLDNAVKYTPAGGTVTVRAEAAGADARIVVSDTGVGIEPQDVPHIFDRLFRGDRSRSESGLGLGLATVQAVVSAHGGSVSVQSDVGAGSTFVIRLPRGGNITKV